MKAQLVVFALLVGCSSGGSSTGAGSRDSFIAQVCDQYMPCCVKAGKPSDGAQCRAFYGAFASTAGYDAAVANACLTELKAASSSPTFCDDGMSSTKSPSCSRVFSAPNGTKKPGETCAEDGECAPSSEGTVDCRSAFVSGATIKKCQVQVPGKLGDGPCLGTRDGNSTSYNSSGDTDVLPRGFMCDVKDGVRCDSTTDKCVAIAKIGEACTSTSSNVCTKDAYCDTTAKQCVARKLAGAACESFSTQCAEGTYCDSKTKVCTTSVAVGGACTTSSECVTKSCVNSKCAVSSSLTTAFLCGG